MPTRKRNYRKEYDTYHGTEKQKNNRVKRNAARRSMVRNGKVTKGDGKEVDHKIPLDRGGGNGKSNLRVSSSKANKNWRKSKSGYNA